MITKKASRRGLLIIFIMTNVLIACSSQRGFPSSNKHRKKNKAIMQKSKTENKKRFLFLTRDKIQYKKYQPNIPF
jgi:hypothetical protein